MKTLIKLKPFGFIGLTLIMIISLGLAIWREELSILATSSQLILWLYLGYFYSNSPERITGTKNALLLGSRTRTSGGKLFQVTTSLGAITLSLLIFWNSEQTFQLGFFISNLCMIILIGIVAYLGFFLRWWLPVLSYG